MKFFTTCFLLAAPAVFAQDVFARKTSTPAKNDLAPQENARVELYRQQTEQLAEHVNAMRQDNAQLEQRVETLAKTTAALQAENTRLRDDVKKLSDANAALLDDTRKLGEELVKVKLDREALRKQITDDIMARITTIIEKSANAKPAGNANTTGKETGRLHVVEAGQTLSEIATAYKSTVPVIMKANNLKSADKLSIGQELFIPDP